MIQQITILEFILISILVGVSLMIVFELRNELYRAVSWLLGYIPDVLLDRYNRRSVMSTPPVLRTIIILLDPIISWISLFFIIFLYYLVNYVSYSMYLEVMILYLSVGLSFIFPWRMYMRIEDFFMNRFVILDLLNLFVMKVSNFIFTIIIHYILVFNVRDIILNYFYGLYSGFLKPLVEYQYLLYLAAFIPYIITIIWWELYQQVILIRLNHNDSS